MVSLEKLFKFTFQIFCILLVPNASIKYLIGYWQNCFYSFPFLSPVRLLKFHDIILILFRLRNKVLTSVKGLERPCKIFRGNCLKSQAIGIFIFLNRFFCSRGQTHRECLLYNSRFGGICLLLYLLFSWGLSLFFLLSLLCLLCEFLTVTVLIFSLVPAA